MKISALILLLIFALGACNTHSDSYTDAMAHEHTGDSPTTNEVATMEPSLPISGEWVTYGTVDGKELKGYLSKPQNATEPLPALIVIHEWWGLNDNIKQMADLLAGEGYVALAVDFYDGRIATTPDSAQTYMRSVMGNLDRGRQLVTAAATWLKNDHQAPKLGVMGWCFGGAWSLNTSLAVPNLIDATVIYYGNLNTNPADLAKLDMPILGIFGAEDRGIPVASVNRFETVLDSLGKSVDIHIYEGANHAFANPSGGRYNADAAADAWGKTIAFLHEHLK